jgi:Protein of unknown function (DUF3606)
MPDDLTNKAPQAEAASEPHEVQYLAHKFKVSKEQLSKAVKNVGHSAAVIGRRVG